MDLTALLLSRLQFAFTVSFHIIFPSFTIGLAAWLTHLDEYLDQFEANARENGVHVHWAKDAEHKGVVLVAGMTATVQIDIHADHPSS